MSEAKGKIKETVGWATGDRHVEAEGRVEQEAADPANPVDEVSDETVEAEEKELREERGEYQPDA